MYEIVKRLFDIVVSSILLIVTAPLQALVAVIVAKKIGRPVIFKQERAGKEGKPFTLVKFRTMTDIDHDRGLITDEQRLTPFGHFLRSSSIDELPSFWNVVRGDMSLVGTRPLPVRYVARYSPEHARRLDVRPGVTGIPQVSGRNSLTWEQKFDLDVQYVESRSFSLDILILFKTVSTVTARKGISQEGHATMTEFGV